MDRAPLTSLPALDTPIAFVDVEIMGTSAGVHRVIDVAVIGMTGDRVDFEWQTLVNPGERVSAGISALTGIDNAARPPLRSIVERSSFPDMLSVTLIPCWKRNS